MKSILQRCRFSKPFPPAGMMFVSGYGEQPFDQIYGVAR